MEPHLYEVLYNTIRYTMLSLKKNILDVERISEIRRTIEKKNSVFAERKYLDNPFLPSEIIG